MSTPYNGFSWAERRATLPIRNAAFRDGSLQRPDTCSICGFSAPDDLEGRGYIFSHLEDYRRPLEILPCCKICHAVLHARFHQPRAWLDLVQCHGTPGCWFADLTMDPASRTRSFDALYPLGLPKLTRNSKGNQDHVDLPQVPLRVAGR